LKDEEAIDWCKRISKLSLDKENKLKEGHGGLPKRGLGVYVKKEKEGRKENECEEDCFFLVLMCGDVLMGSVCVTIKHETNLCSKCLWQSLWTFSSISCFSQIHCWICVKFESVLA
jgi:hypothetical protein